MIMADVYVPSIGRQYDFSLDEQAQISQLIPEIAEVICQKENCIRASLDSCSSARRRSCRFFSAGDRAASS